MLKYTTASPTLNLVHMLTSKFLSHVTYFVASSFHVRRRLRSFRFPSKCFEKCVCFCPMRATCLACELRSGLHPPLTSSVMYSPSEPCTAPRNAPLSRDRICITQAAACGSDGAWQGHRAGAVSPIHHPSSVTHSPRN